MAHYDKVYRLSFARFHRFLIKHPTLGATHPFGHLLDRASRRAVKRTLEPATWFRARVGENFTIADFSPPNPEIHRVGAGRFNAFGQMAYYLAQAPAVAAMEAMRVEWADPGYRRAHDIDIAN